MTKLTVFVLALSLSRLALTPLHAIEVTHAGDGGLGSLRNAVAFAESNPGPDTITFAPALSGATIRLQTQIATQDRDGVTIDGSALPRAVTIDGDSNGNGAADDTRLFFHASLFGPGVHLIGLRLIRGFAPVGGAILCDGRFTLTRCTLSGNVATLRGGAVDSEFSLVANQSTFSGNSAGESGGAIYSPGFTDVQLRHCTLAGNTAPTGADVFCGDDVHIEWSIVTSLATDGSVTGQSSLVNTTAALAPLGDYGGPIPTMALLPASSARDAATASSTTIDQRGSPIVGPPDIGAYEAGTIHTYAAWQWETRPATASAAERAPDSDFDSDARSNLVEYATLTDGKTASGGALPSVTRTIQSPSLIEFTVRPEAGDVLYELERSHPGVGPWVSIAQVNPATNTITSAPGVTVVVNGTTLQFSDTTLPGESRVFYRLRVRLP